MLPRFHYRALQLSKEGRYGSELYIKMQTACDGTNGALVQPCSSKEPSDPRYAHKMDRLFRNPDRIPTIPRRGWDSVRLEKNEGLETSNPSFFYKHSITWIYPVRLEKRLQ